MSFFLAGFAEIGRPLSSVGLAFSAANIAIYSASKKIM
jgi:hypothetical protein